VYFAPQLTGFPLEFVISARDQRTRAMGLAVWIQSTDVTGGQTDGRTPGDSKDCAYA